MQVQVGVWEEVAAPGFRTHSAKTFSCLMLTADTNKMKITKKKIL